jgi:hemoglobin/transferrin/lactoferrin receptor protein
MPGPSRYPQADWASYGAYAQVQKRYNSRWLVQAGARLAGAEIDAVFDTTFYPFPYTTANLASGALTGSLGTTFTPNDAWTLRANLSTGYRAPNVDDMGKVFDSEPGTVIVPNPDLKAEYAWNAEAGAAWRIGRVTLNATAYYTLLSNAMVRRPFTLNGMDSIYYDGELSEVMAIQNAAKATVYGLQGGVDIDLGSGFYSSADINYQVGEEELDDGSTAPSRHAPPVFGRVELGYALDRLHLVANVQFSGKKDFDDLAPEEQDKPEIYAIDDLGRPWSPAWTTVNLRAMYSIEGKFTFTAGLENILDVRYRPYSSGIVAPGRNATLAVQVAF